MIFIKGIDPNNQALGFSQEVDMSIAKETILEQLNSRSGKDLIYYLEEDNKFIGYFDSKTNELIINNNQ